MKTNRMASIILLFLSLTAVAVGAEKPSPAAKNGKLVFPMGTATPSEVCGECHKSIYREYAFGFGSDLVYRAMGKDGKPDIPENVSSNATSHALAGVDPFPMHARLEESDGKSCNVCHFPEPFAIPDMDISELYKPKGRAKEKEQLGLTCASCHLTPEGKIRGPYNLRAPHETHADVKMKTSLACAYCHSLGKRVPGMQTQTFLEWREDFFKKGLGRQNCQDCHMPHTIRRLSSDSAFPERVSARHLWTGGRSLQRLQNALSQVIVQPKKNVSSFEFHVINIGAGHSVPSGSNRRAVYLIAEVVGQNGATVASRQWMFAPWYSSRPDDRKYLDEDRKLPDAKAAMQADAQGPHEDIIRAGEERVLSWNPDLKPGKYTLKSKLIYDLNRYNETKKSDDQTVFGNASMEVSVQ